MVFSYSCFHACTAVFACNDKEWMEICVFEYLKFGISGRGNETSKRNGALQTCDRMVDF